MITKIFLFFVPHWVKDKSIVDVSTDALLLPSLCLLLPESFIIELSFFVVLMVGGKIAFVL
jgi:hypothetical protein